MKFFLILIGCICSSLGLTQETAFPSWEKVNELSIGKDEVWAVDGIGNIIMTNKKVIQKYDSTGQKVFTQSIKSIGKITKIDPVNTMKIVLFSSDQQQFCTMDNTLTLAEKCIDFSDFEIDNAIEIATSSQPDKLWVLDQLNSTLFLLSLSASNQNQEVKNLNGILNLKIVESLLEIDNYLFLSDLNSTIYQFDLYGTLINSFETETFSDFKVFANNLIILSNDSLEFISLTEKKSEILALPLKDVFKFYQSNGLFYFQSENKLSTYRLILKP